MLEDILTMLNKRLLQLKVRILCLKNQCLLCTNLNQLNNLCLGH